MTSFLRKAPCRWPGLRSRSRSRPESVVLTGVGVGVGVGKISSAPTPAWSRSRLQSLLLPFPANRFTITARAGNLDFSSVIFSSVHITDFCPPVISHRPMTRCGAASVHTPQSGPAARAVHGAAHKPTIRRPRDKRWRIRWLAGPQ